MDATFSTYKGKFNYRVAAVIIDKNRLLITHREGDPYLHLPGGRVKIGETAEDAIIRELKEELHIEASINRPLWFNQAFFEEATTGCSFHELCIYFLMDISKTNLLNFGDHFTTMEQDKTHAYRWLTFEGAKDKKIYPSFLSNEITNLPKSFLIKTENQQ